MCEISDDQNSDVDRNVSPHPVHGPLTDLTVLPGTQTQPSFFCLRVDMRKLDVMLFLSSYDIFPGNEPHSMLGHRHG